MTAPGGGGVPLTPPILKPGALKKVPQFEVTQQFVNVVSDSKEIIDFNTDISLINLPQMGNMIDLTVYIIYVTSAEVSLSYPSLLRINLDTNLDIYDGVYAGEEVGSPSTKKGLSISAESMMASGYAPLNDLTPAYTGDIHASAYLGNMHMSSWLNYNTTGSYYTVKREYLFDRTPYSWSSVFGLLISITSAASLTSATVNWRMRFYSSQSVQGT